MLRKGRIQLLQNLSDDRIKEFVQKYLDQYKKGLEDRNLSVENPFMNEEDFHQYVGDLDYMKADKIAELGIGNYRHVEKIVDGILKEEGIEGIEKDSADYIKLAEAFSGHRSRGSSTRRSS